MIKYLILDETIKLPNVKGSINKKVVWKQAEMLLAVEGGE